MRISQTRQGFTLPELLLTVLILSYSLSVILTTYVNSIALNDASRNLTTAVSHAEFVLEDIRNAAFSSTAANISSGNWNWNSSTITTKGLKALNSESITASSSGTNPLDITVTVFWNDMHSRSRSQTLQTSITG
jgi:prepilin-type N-terminal cleavage/methylation domain-containing protein